MKTRARLAAGSVGLIALATLTASLLGPADNRWLLVVCSGLAIGAAAQSAAGEPGDLLPALLFSAPPIMSLTADGSPDWLMALLACLLLAAAELNVLAREYDGVAPGGAALRHRMLQAAVVCAAGALAGAIGLISGRLAPGLGGAGVLVAAVSVAFLARVSFPTRARGTRETAGRGAA